jgi:DNA-binding CsgD family transcriptional regulator
MRESEFLRVIGGGCSNQEGGMRLQIIHRTFESYRARLKRKFGARNVADLLRLATLDRQEEIASALQGNPTRSSGTIRC